VSDESSPKRLTVLGVAAIVTGLCGFVLVAVGWWFRDWDPSSDRQRLDDGSWWAGVVSQGLGYLAFGKLGFKVALATVAGSIGVTAWARRRSKENAAGPPGVTGAPPAWCAGFHAAIGAGTPPDDRRGRPE